MPPSEPVYSVAITFKMTEWEEQRIYIKFCVKLEHSSTEAIQMIQKETKQWVHHKKKKHFEGDCGAIVSCTSFLVSRLFSNKCLFLKIIIWMDIFWTDLYFYIHDFSFGISGFLIFWILENTVTQYDVLLIF